MSTLILTLLFSFIIVILALCSLGIGWLLTGKSKMRAGMCGKIPNKKKDEAEGCSTNITCDLCRPDNEKKS